VREPPIKRERRSEEGDPMTAPTPEQRAAWRRHADEDGYVSLGVYELHALLDALDAAEAKVASDKALVGRLLDLCDSADSDNYGRVAVDVSDLWQAIADWLGVRWDEDLRVELDAALNPDD
jgi:hypothetical protein